MVEREGKPPERFGPKLPPVSIPHAVSLALIAGLSVAQDPGSARAQELTTRIIQGNKHECIKIINEVTDDTKAGAYIVRGSPPKKSKDGKLQFNPWKLVVVPPDRKESVSSKELTGQDMKVVFEINRDGKLCRIEPTEIEQPPQPPERPLKPGEVHPLPWLPLPDGGQPPPRTGEPPPPQDFQTKPPPELELPSRPDDLPTWIPKPKDELPPIPIPPERSDDVTRGGFPQK